VVRVNFTADDVARTRFTLIQSPLVETMLAFAALRRVASADGGGASQASPWMDEARRAFPATARPLFDLLGARAESWPHLFEKYTPDLGEGLEQVRATARASLRAQLSDAWIQRPERPPLWVRNLAGGHREELEIVVRALRDLHAAVVAPRWDEAVAAFHADVARRAPVLIAGGHEALLSTLHPRLRWREGGLDLKGGDFECDLGGHGLLLRPTAFWGRGPVFSLDSTGQRANTLLYPVLATRHGDGSGPDSLAALLGLTRAAVLRSLREPLGTTELAAAAGISPASASEHAKVLRGAALVETRRQGRAVRHSLTSLGATLVGQLPATGRRVGGEAEGGTVMANGLEGPPA